MRALTLAELAELVDGTLVDAAGGALPGDADAGGRPIGPEVVLDSRSVTTGAVFCAVVGDHVDGHRFVAAALRSGAATALVHHDDVAGLATTDVLVRVDDVRSALGRLARGLVDRAKPRGLRVVGITGSMGKTSTKDLLGTVLESVAPTIAPRSSFNNEWGLPLTATRIDDTTRFLVSEMGARGVGHIRHLCALTPPDVGVVLNVAHAHIGEFGSQQAIAQAKGELVESLPADGTAVLNAADPLVAAMARRTVAPVLWFDPDGPPGPDGPAVWASAVTADDRERCRFRLAFRTAEGLVEHPVGLATPGRHQVGNAVAAAAAAHALGIPPDVIAAALDGAALQSRWRMELSEVADGGLLINDAYNANPEAVLAALDTAAQMAGNGGRGWGVVLGDMLELGEAAPADHRRVGAAVARRGADWAVFVGAHAADLTAGAVAAGFPATAVTELATRDDAARVALDRRRPGQVVLVKASRGIELEHVAADLLAALGGPVAEPIR